MCHVMRKLLTTIGVHPTVIELVRSQLYLRPPLMRYLRQWP
ncbi:hypothetical protein Patl1_02552 [Pistacia atlantica]|uniref:Uncharacterized protein n=1 Tax=Pistacia atlantica TaxID=434234 RepID=A0ACC1CB19_9ROSI|nr:hypothetical protein Patl1_02552 [Pistacia atlantica]